MGAARTRAADVQFANTIMQNSETSGLKLQGLKYLKVHATHCRALQYISVKNALQGLQVACAADECSTELLYITAGMQSASLFFCASHDYAG